MPRSAHAHLCVITAHAAVRQFATLPPLGCTGVCCRSAVRDPCHRLRPTTLPPAFRARPCPFCAAVQAKHVIDDGEVTRGRFESEMEQEQEAERQKLQQRLTKHRQHSHAKQHPKASRPNRSATRLLFPPHSLIHNHTFLAVQSVPCGQGCQF